MAVCPQCQHPGLGEGRGGKSLKEKLRGKSNWSRSGLKRAEESYGKSFSDHTIFFCKAGCVCGVGHEDGWTSMGPRWEWQRYVGVFLHCGRNTTRSWVAHQPVNKTCLVCYQTWAPHKAWDCFLYARKCCHVSTWMVVQDSGQRKLHLKLPPKLKVQAKLGHLGDVSFPVIWVFEALFSSLFSQGWWWDTESLLGWGKHRESIDKVSL